MHMCTITIHEDAYEVHPTSIISILIYLLHSLLVLVLQCMFTEYTLLCMQLQLLQGTYSGVYHELTLLS